MDWDEIDRVLGIVAKSQPNISAEDARKMAISQLGLEKLFMGQVVKLGTKYNITVKLLNLDLRLEQVERVVSDSEERLPETLEDVATRFLTKEAAANTTVGIRKRDEERAADEKRKQEADRVAQEQARLQAEAATKAKEDDVRSRLPQAGRRWTNSLGMVFAPVPGTKVLVSIWETRVEDFEAFVKATGHDTAVGFTETDFSGEKPQQVRRGTATWKSPGFQQTGQHPVVGLGWNDVQAFCKWLTSTEGPSKLAPSQSYRLPTDMEWSAAAGIDDSANVSKDPGDRYDHLSSQRRYAWGSQWPPPSNAGNYGDAAAIAKFRKDIKDHGERYRRALSRIEKPSQVEETLKTFLEYNGKRMEEAVVSDDPFEFTAPVGSFSPNPLGLFDMGGNVMEWGADLAYPSDETMRRLGSGGNRVLRDNSWASMLEPVWTDLGVRIGDTPPDGYFGQIGFRCVLDLGTSR